MEEKSCSIIGHRKVNNPEEVAERLEKVVIDLVQKRNVIRFLFGEIGEFNNIAYNVISKLKNQFYKIKLICYQVQDDAIKSIEQKQLYERFLSEKLNKKVEFMMFDENVLVEKALNSKKGKYIVRNKEMINNADLCLFYVERNYVLGYSYSKNNMIMRKKTSGTNKALEFAKMKNKEIIYIESMWNKLNHILTKKQEGDFSLFLLKFCKLRIKIKFKKFLVYLLKL